jgi:hypothetical protein
MIPTSCLTYTQAWLHLIAFGKNSISDFKQKKTAKAKTFASTQNKVNWNSRDSFGVFGSLFNLFFKNIPSNLIFLDTNIFFLI